MYTARNDPLSRLRAYRSELNVLYAQALARRDASGARRLFDRRRTVQREILLREEWLDCPTANPEIEAEVAAILQRR